MLEAYAPLFPAPRDFSRDGPARASAPPESAAGLVAAEPLRDTLLRRAAPFHARGWPFPYALCEPALPAQDYAALLREFPSRGWFSADAQGVHGRAWRVPSSRVIDAENFPASWRALVAQHGTQAFWRRIVRRFGDDIRRLHPDLESRFERPLESWRAQGAGADFPAEITLECRIVLRPAGAGGASLMPPDPARRLWTGLLMMPLPGEPAAIDRLHLSRLGAAQADADGEAAREGGHSLACRPNRFVGFAHAADRWVAFDAPAACARRYVEFSADLNHPRFGLLQISPASRRWFRFFPRERKA